MRYDHFNMLPEKAFRPIGRKMTLEGGGGGGLGGLIKSVLPVAAIAAPFLAPEALGLGAAGEAAGAAEGAGALDAAAGVMGLAPSATIAADTAAGLVDAGAGLGSLGFDAASGLGAAGAAGGAPSIPSITPSFTESAAAGAPSAVAPTAGQAASEAAAAVPTSVAPAASTGAGFGGGVSAGMPGVGETGMPSLAEGGEMLAPGQTMSPEALAAGSQTRAPVVDAITRAVTPQATTSTAQDLATIAGKALGPVGNVSNAMNIASTLYSMGQNKKAQQYLQQQTDQMKALGAPATAVGQQILSNYQAGKLTPSDASRIDQWAIGQKAQLRDYYARAGMADSSMAQQALAQVDQQAEQMRQQAMQNMMKSGLSALGVGAGPVQSAIQTQMQGDASLQQSQAKFLKALAAMGAAGSQPAASGG